MKEVVASLQTGKCQGYLQHPKTGITPLKCDVVNGLKLPGAEPLKFTHFSLPNEGNTTQNLTLSENIAERIYKFCEATYVNGHGNFDCHTFLGQIMGWNTGICAGLRKNFYGRDVKPRRTINCLPYVIAPSEDNVAHSLLGIDKPGKSLSVVGFEYPLIIAKNTDLLKTFGGTAMFEVIQVEAL